MNTVNINKKEKLSEHFTLGEMTKTSYKTADGNIPSHVAIENLKRLCSWLEMLRSEWNKRYGEGDDPIIINSAYRSWEVNKRAGGSSTSNHLVGCAADIKCFGIEQALRYAVILLDIADNAREDLTSSRACSHSAESKQASLCSRSTADFDELLIECSPQGNYWLHFAVRPPSRGNRRKVKYIQT